MKTEQDWVKEWREDSSLNRWRYDELELEKRIKQIQLDAQKHGEQIGWEKGMAEASEIAIKCISRQFSAHYHGASLIIRDSIIEARDKNQNKL